MGQELEKLNYTDTSRLIEAFEEYIEKGKNCKYNLDLLSKMKRNKETLYNIVGEAEENEGWK